MPTKNDKRTGVNFPYPTSAPGRGSGTSNRRMAQAAATARVPIAKAGGQGRQIKK